MKKIQTITVGLTLTAALLVLGGCGTAKSTTSSSDQQLFQGVGQTSVFRVKVDSATKKESYSTSTVTASAIFDKNDKIVNVQFDTLEIVPESKKEGSTVFPGWPSEKVIKEDVTKSVASWKTKRERGDAAYGMNWSEQVDLYQDFFKGKTVAEIEQWFAKNTSDTNGKPLSDQVTSDADKAKFASLSDTDKKALADVTSGASISLKDDHGDFIGALKEAYENKKEVTVSAAK